MVEKKRIYPKKRQYSFWTKSKVLEELERNGLRLSPSTFTRLEDKGFFLGRRTPYGWRVYSERDIPIIIKILKASYNVD